MYDACSMMRRTTITAEAEDVETLRREARRQGISLARLMGAVVATKAAEIRAARRPRVALFRSEGGIADASVEDEHAPAAAPYES